MKIEQGHIDEVRRRFVAMEDKNDLVALLNAAKVMLYGDDADKIELKYLTYYANPTNCKSRYRTFTVKKKSGSDRMIHSPKKGLKSILRVFNFVLQCMDQPHKAATGFVLDKSIVDNAKVHTGSKYVYNIDLKDFFHSFDLRKVRLGLMSAPFNLKDDKEPLAYLLASLCTHPLEIEGETRVVLPQGSPTSPTLTNILCKTLDRRLNGLAKRFGVRYSRYADDITISSDYNVYKNEMFMSELERIINEDNLYKFGKKETRIGFPLEINPSKTRLQKIGYRQEVTGLIVNEKVNVRPKYIKQLRMWLYYWEKYGYTKAEQIFKKDYLKDKGHLVKGEVHFQNVLDGKLEFLKMVKGEKDTTYQSLLSRYNKLVGKTSFIDDILDVWEKEGIERAVELHSKKH